MQIDDLVVTQTTGFTATGSIIGTSIQITDTASIAILNATDAVISDLSVTTINNSPLLDGTLTVSGDVDVNQDVNASDVNVTNQLTADTVSTNNLILTGSIPDITVDNNINVGGNIAVDGSVTADGGFITTATVNAGYAGFGTVAISSLEVFEVNSTGILTATQIESNTVETSSLDVNTITRGDGNPISMGEFFANDAQIDNLQSNSITAGNLLATVLSSSLSTIELGSVTLGFEVINGNDDLMITVAGIGSITLPID